MPKAKRGNNEGSIYRLPGGRWRAAMTLPSGGRKVFGGATRAEAAGKLSAALTAQDKGLPSLDETVTVAAFLDRWLDEVVRPDARATTLASYQMHVRLHLVPALGRIRLARLQPSDVQRMMTAKLADGLSPATVQRQRATLRAALNHALRWGLVSRNAAQLAIPPRSTATEVKPFTVDEARAILEAAKDDPFGPLYGLALSTGMRLGEILGLCWGDVDFDKRTIEVRRTLVRVQGKPILTDPKSAKARRTLPLPAMVASGMNDQRAFQQAARLLAGSRWQPVPIATGNQGEGPAVVPDLVFTNSTGGALHGKYVHQRFQRLLQRAGLPIKRVHDMRHSCASFLMAQGMNLRGVMEQLGHSQIGLTMNTYAHIAPEVLRDAADRMDAMFSGPAPTADDASGGQKVATSVAT